MFSPDRNQLRLVFIRAWRKASSAQPLEPLETRIVEILRQHPEYQALLDDGEQALERDFPPEQGESNPFLHLGLHLTILEQLSIDQPAGIRRIYQRLVKRTGGDTHEAEHRIMDCLADAIWKLQHDKQPFNANAYLQCIKRGGGA